MPQRASNTQRSTSNFFSTASNVLVHSRALSLLARCGDSIRSRSHSRRPACRIPGCRLVAAITRWSGVTPFIAVSKVARVMPLACASATARPQMPQRIDPVRATARFEPASRSRESCEAAADHGRFRWIRQFVSHVIAAIPTPAPCRSSRPAISSSSSTVRTIAGDVRDNRTKSSIDTASARAMRSDAGRSSSAGCRLFERRLRRFFCATATGALRPRIGSITAITSAASVTGVAPCLSSPLVPSLRGSSGEPGTAKTSRPCSPASRAVISDPERRAASTITTPSESPEIRRLRRGNRERAAPRRTASPKLPRPRSIRRSRPASSTCSGGIDAIDGRRRARQWSPSQRLARWAAASMPRASPDTMAKPASPSSCAMRPANFAPAAEALREPTIGDRRPSQTQRSLPRRATTGGGSSIICRREGYSGFAKH